MAPGSTNDLEPRGDATAAASNAAAIAPPGHALRLGSGEVGSRLTHSPGADCSDDEGCARDGSLRKSAETRRVIRCVQQHVRLANSNSPPSGKFTGVSKCVEETSSHFCR